MLDWCLIVGIEQERANSLGVNERNMGSYLPEEITKVLDAGIAFIYSFQPIVEPTVVLGSCFIVHFVVYDVNECTIISNLTEL